MLIFAQSTGEAKVLSREYRERRLTRIYGGIYTNEQTMPIEDIVLTHWMDIIGYLYPDSILTHRTAIELKPTPFENQHVIFITASYSKSIQLPGLLVKISKGNQHDYIERVTPRLSRSQPSRAYLENTSIVRGANLKGIKTLTQDELEKRIAKELAYKHEEGLNDLRDEAKAISEKLGLHYEYKQLNKIISALLSTHDEPKFLTNAYAKALAKKEPFDDRRIKLFDNFIVFLKKCSFIERPFAFNKTAYSNLSFYESYFSNYIEGTEFLIDEAEDIVFQGKAIENRHADSHDVLSHYKLSSNITEMTETPNTVQECIDLLQERHAVLMSERPDKQPGILKTKDNKAGNTIFVSAQNLIGTLTLGFERYQILEDGLEKALFMQFLITETHPFIDGNGRLSRMMMNAELVNAGQSKIIIPTAHRDNYMNGLRLMTREELFKTYVKVMDQAQAYTHSIDWLDYGGARETLEAHYADKTPDEGLPIFNRALRQLPLSGIA